MGTYKKETHSKDLYELYKHAEKNTKSDFISIFRWLRNQNQILGINDLLKLQQYNSPNYGHWEVPLSVIQLYNILLNSRKSKNILDPVGKLGLLGGIISENENVQNVDIVSSLHESEEIIQSVNMPKVSLTIGNIIDLKDNLKDNYDAIIGIPPINNKGDVNNNLVETAKMLSKEGIIAFVVPPRIAWDKSKKSIKVSLENNGLYLSALLQFRPGTFTTTNIPFYLAIFEKVNHDTLFVGEVPEKYDEYDELIKCFSKRKEGETINQGRLVDPNNFNGIKSLKAKERAKKLASERGLKPIPFDKVVHTINTPKKRGKDFERFDEHPDAVYLPQMATTEAKTHQNDLSPKLKSYLQLIVNHDVVLPEYLAEWLNTTLGIAFRESAMQGITIPRINKSNLLLSNLYLPSVIDQRKALDALLSIQEMKSDLDELGSKIWYQPLNVSEVITSLEKINREEVFGDWIESLPYPLASILRSYDTVDQTDKDKYERLLLFYEGFAEFCATVHISAFKKQPAIWEPLKNKIKQVMAENNFSFEKPTFGLWASITSILAKELRSMINGKQDDKDATNALYETADLEPLEILSSKSLVNLINETNKKRNDWSGHTGAVSQKEARERHDHLKNQLSNLHKIIGDLFQQYKLVEAEPSGIDALTESKFKCKVKLVMGSNPLLERQTLQLSMTLITGSLYMYNIGNDRVLELVPFIQVTESPQSASYFYNRVEKEGLRLVSYQVINESEIFRKNQYLEDLIKSFT
ncbi:DNA methyltransferase family protein [Methanohalophilus halophilus]|uniref:DNA methylase adenine-specific domain-containing protein n=1 Tax=Methanohalophilus halophilus TaxID=2177 RepID=A0A1L3Q047_9EURY|nr:hypothetical protein [Methanohalophilus halophilus]APH38229.1 hypothetical protein BHR79_01170 [Methanohalophilus halophilus]RNI10904.1 hypothetical protein EFE40_01620 [Methanohalophilus halophilus]SDV99852.1 hypothetical protein SAMN04515625_0056 [Methanohalophilus halophilus]